MKEVAPYNSGELRKSPEGNVMILGHIWWPVERCNAYHCIYVNDKGEPKNDSPEYIWDSRGDSGGKWPEYIPVK